MTLHIIYFHHSIHRTIFFNNLTIFWKHEVTLFWWFWQYVFFLCSDFHQIFNSISIGGNLRIKFHFCCWNLTAIDLFPIRCQNLFSKVIWHFKSLWSQRECFSTLRTQWKPFNRYNFIVFLRGSSIFYTITYVVLQFFACFCSL